MKIGDKVIYIFDPYPSKNYPLEDIVIARLTRLSGVKNPAIKPIKNLVGNAGMHEQVTNSSFLYELGDYKVIRKIFERGINLEQK